MRLRRVEVGPSPDRADAVRVTGTVYYETAGASEPYWFEVPAAVSPSLARTGNPWVACLLPLAFWLGEPLQLDVDVDERLRDNARLVLHTWHEWFPEHAVVEVDAPFPASPGAAPPRTVALFSGGVDSLFTVLRREPAGFDEHLGSIDDLLHIWGFDYPWNAASTFDGVRSMLEPLAGELGKQLVFLRTNLRETRFSETPWSVLSHGCFLAAAGLFLEERYGRVLIPASHAPGFDQAWGSNPRVDPLLSTTRTRIVHDGAERTRVDRTRVVARSDAALRALRVCWKQELAGNCGSCGKCLRTMAALELLGALERCPTFPRTVLDLDRLAHLFAVDRSAESFLLEIRALALALDRTDVLQSLDRSLTRTHRLRPAWRACESLKHVPFLWRWADPLERRLLSHSVV